MNYYSFHIGDYAAHTRNLSLLEDLAYRRLLDAYYLAERPFNGSAADVAREIGMREQVAEVEYVLGKFFELTDAGWTNKRAEKEIAHFSDKKHKASEAGKASAQRRSNGRSTSVGKDAAPVGVSSTNVQPTNNQEPITINTSPIGDGATNPSFAANVPLLDNCPHQQIIALYHEQLPTAIRVREWTPARAQALRTRWREKPQRQNLEWWERFFGYISESEFLMGRTQAAGRKPFEIDLEWICQSKNFVKIIEGKFHEAKEVAA